MPIAVKISMDVDRYSLSVSAFQNILIIYYIYNHTSKNISMKNFTKVTILLICFSCSFSFGQKKYSVVGKNITQLNITYDNTAVAAPGNQIPIGITAVSAKKKGYTTKGMLEGKTPWKNYKITVDGGRFEKGYVIIHKDARQIKNHKVRVTACPVDNENVKESITLKITYDVDVIADFSGRDGMDGMDGRPGRSGSDGNDANAGDGGDGTNAKDGTDGRDGDNGKHGYNIAVYATIINEPVFEDPLLKVKIKNLDNGLSHYYLINAEKNTITINTDGGNGGNGGNGGSGGNGGNGGNGGFSKEQFIPAGKGGNGGNGGDAGMGGSGGSGGSAGTITVELDPSVKQYSKALSFSFAGGTGGKKGNSGNAGKFGERGRGGLGSGAMGVKGTVSTDGVEGPVGNDAAEPIIKFSVIDFDW